MPGWSRSDRLETAGEDADVGADVRDFEQPGLNSVVKIGGEVGNLVGKIDELGLKGRAMGEEVGRELRMGSGGVIAGVFHDAFADGEGKVETAVSGVALLKMLNDAEGVEVVIEAEIMALQATIECTLTGVAERWMADIVDECEGLSEIFVHIERAGDGASDLRDFNGCGSGESGNGQRRAK